jgi:hypothetical protein
MFQKGKQMITGKDLQTWGLQQGPIFKTALKVLGVSRRGFGRPQVEVSFRAMLADPEAFARPPSTRLA